MQADKRMRDDGYPLRSTKGHEKSENAFVAFFFAQEIRSSGLAADLAIRRERL